MQRAPAGAAPDVSQGSMAVHADELHVFADLHDGTAGLCLSALRTAARSAVSGGGSCSACNKRATSSKASARDAVVKKTLTKVGHGLVLSRRPPASSPFELSSGNPDGDGVWLYNCSEFPVFVDSRSLRASTAAGSGRFDVCRILPGQSVRVYERRLVDRVRMAAAAEIASGCCENIWSAAVDSVACYDSVLVSFVKGWSGRYKRQTVMSCPCWLEIIIYESNFDR